MGESYEKGGDGHAAGGRGSLTVCCELCFVVARQRDCGTPGSRAKGRSFECSAFTVKKRRVRLVGCSEDVFKGA